MVVQGSVLREHDGKVTVFVKGELKTVDFFDLFPLFVFRFRSFFLPLLFLFPSLFFTTFRFLVSLYINFVFYQETFFSYVNYLRIVITVSSFSLFCV